MAVIKIVLCLKDRTCGICQKPIKVGEYAIKDRRHRKQTKQTLYSHPECYGGKKHAAE